jgi:MarR family
MRYRPGSVPPFGLTAPRWGRAAGLGVEPRRSHHGRRQRSGQPRGHTLPGSAQDHAHAARTVIDRSVASRHAARLAQAGLIERLPNPADRRPRILSLTGADRQAVRQMRQRLAAALD